MKKLLLTVCFLSALADCASPVVEISQCRAYTHGTLAEDAQRLHDDALYLQAQDRSGAYNQQRVIAELNCMRPQVDEFWARVQRERPDIAPEMKPLIDGINCDFESLNQ